MNEMNREVLLRQAVQEKTLELLQLGIVITDIERVKKDSILTKRYLGCTVNKKEDVEAFARFCMSQVNEYAEQLQKEPIVLDVTITEHPTGEMTFEELLEKETPRKLVEKEILNACTNYNIQLVKDFLDKMYEIAIKEAIVRGKNAVHFKFFANGNLRISQNLLKIQKEIKNGIYTGDNLYQRDIGAEEMIVLLSKKQDGKLFFLREGVNLLLKKDSNLHWEFI